MSLLDDVANQKQTDRESAQAGGWFLHREHLRLDGIRPDLLRGPLRPVGAVGAINDTAGKDRLVTHQRAERRQAGNAHGAAARSRREVTLAGNNAVDGQNATRRHVLAKRHEVGLVVGGVDDAGAV